VGRGEKRKGRNGEEWQVGGGGEGRREGREEGLEDARECEVGKGEWEEKEMGKREK